MCSLCLLNYYGTLKLDNYHVLIGFINEPYTAPEIDGEAFVDIGVIFGDLQINVVFQLTFSSGSALGNVNKLHLKHDPHAT